VEGRLLQTPGIQWVLLITVVLKIFFLAMTVLAFS
jgi:hypothetical protein